MAASPSFTRSRADTIRKRWRTLFHWRTIVALLALALAVFVATVLPRMELQEYVLLLVIGLVFLASQIFWLRRAIDVGERLIRRGSGRSRIAALVGLAYLFVVAYSFPTTRQSLAQRRPHPV